MSKNISEIREYGEYGLSYVVGFDGVISISEEPQGETSSDTWFVVRTTGGVIAKMNYRYVAVVKYSE